VEKRKGNYRFFGPGFYRIRGTRRKNKRKLHAILFSESFAVPDSIELGVHVEKGTENYKFFGPGFYRIRGARRKKKRELHAILFSWRLRGSFRGKNKKQRTRSSIFGGSGPFPGPENKRKLHAILFPWTTNGNLNA
jgi:hypothetical protein